MPKTTLPAYLSLQAALREFVTVAGTQAQQHIRPIHKSIREQGGFEAVLGYAPRLVWS